MKRSPLCPSSFFSYGVYAHRTFFVLGEVMTLSFTFRVLVIVAVGLTSACANRPDWRGKRVPHGEEEERTPSRVITMPKQGAAAASFSQESLVGKGPDFLAFSKADDRVIARVGDEELHKSQVFDAMVETQPEQVRATIAVLLGNRVLAAQCENHNIRVDDREIAAWFAGHRNLMLQQAVVDFGKGTDFRTWVRLRFGQSLADYERIACNREKAKRLLGRLIRFFELREDRVQIRIISMTNRNQAVAVQKRALEGADFATLAEQNSVHPSAESGGLMPPIWRASLNPALDEIAFELPIGVISDIVQAEDQSHRQRYQIIKVIKRMPGDPQLSYASVEDKIIAGLANQPLTQDEWYMWQLKLEKMAKMSVESF